MTGSSAYEDDMSFFDGPPLDDPELAAFADSVRASLIAPVPPGRQASFVSLLAEEARIARAEEPTAVREPARPARRRLKRVAQAFLALLLVPLAGAGLAVAGVNLPGPAQSAFEKIGVDLPNQQGGPSDAGPAADPAANGPEGAAGEPAPDDAGAAGAAGAKDRPASSKEPDAKDGGRGDSNGRGNAKGGPSQNGVPPNSPSQNGAGNANGRGKSDQAPGHSGSAGNPGGNGKGNAVGRTDAVPPGQANKPASPGNSADAGGGSKKTP
jgi:hypothetical protein